MLTYDIHTYAYIYTCVLQEELEELLLRQSQMKVEYSASQAYLQESTDKLQRIMADVTENADVITYALHKPYIDYLYVCMYVCIYVYVYRQHTKMYVCVCLYMYKILLL